jgi:hypothetical protein
MVKVILKGSQQAQWMIGQRFIPGSIPVELSEAELQTHADVISQVLDENVKKPEVIKKVESIKKIGRPKKVTK